MTQDKPVHKRASRYIRPKNPQPIRFTDRDKLVVKAVNDFRLLRQDQVQRLLFPSRNTAQVRLRKLWEHGFLRRQFLPVVGGIQNSPILYEVDKRGVELLRSEFGYEDEALRYSRNKNIRTQFIEHTLGLSEIRLMVENSCQGQGFTLKTWLDEKTLKADYDKVQVGNKLEAVLPDAYFAISIPELGALHFFVEYDRGPENLKFIKKKMAAYVAYFRSGKCRQRYGTNRVRVLTVNEGGKTKAGKKRLANLKRVTEEVGGTSHFYFTRMANLTTDDVLLAPIWHIAGSSKLAVLIKN